MFLSLQLSDVFKMYWINNNLKVFFRDGSFSSKNPVFRNLKKRDKQTFFENTFLRTELKNNFITLEDPIKYVKVILYFRKNKTINVSEPDL